MKKQLSIALLTLVIIVFGVASYKVAVEISRNIVTEKNDKQVPSMKQYSFDKVGIDFSAPSDMIVTGEYSDNNSFILTVQRGQYPEQNYYQLYGILQETANPTFDTESVKTELMEGSKNTFIGGLTAVQGQYKGERKNPVTLIYTNKGVFKLTTSPPTAESEAITNSILDTLSFTFLNGKNLGDKSDTATSADDAPVGSIHNLPVPEAVSAVKKYVSQESGVREGLIIVMTAYEKDWSDGCLGLGGPAESCLFAITPGYEVTVRVNGEEQKYRTNDNGSVIRREK